ncbi:MAG: YjbQ family protein [Deltaproteobacteria bacterium]|nr:YjbQ family protein [Deltaproteobacteria bacterium]
MHKGIISINTSDKIELIDITTQINQALNKTGCEAGICYLYSPHTTAALTINEGIDPAVQQDIAAVMQRIVPSQFPYKHLEGNSPAHLMSSIIGASEIVFMESGALKLGTWQRIFFCEFDGPRKRNMYWRITGA